MHIRLTTSGLCLGEPEENKQNENNGSRLSQDCHEGLNVKPTVMVMSDRGTLQLIDEGK